jgi:hypothetical protein
VERGQRARRSEEDDGVRGLSPQKCKYSIPERFK